MLTKTHAKAALKVWNHPREDQIASLSQFPAQEALYTLSLIVDGHNHIQPAVWWATVIDSKGEVITSKATVTEVTSMYGVTIGQCAKHDSSVPVVLLENGNWEIVE